MIYFDNNELIIRSMNESDPADLKSAFDNQGWNKDIKILSDYFRQQENGEKYIFIAELKGKVAGYVTLLPQSKTGPFAGKNIPILVDFIVFQKYQRLGIGGRILDAAEKLASNISDTIFLGVGLHSGYGSAQRLYIKRGYIPDGSGVWYRDKRLEPYADCNNDDDLVLYLSKSFK